MLVDFSGSMEGILHSTIKQLIVLVQFCRKVQIPFQVLSFTTGSSDGNNHTENNIVSASNLHLVEILTSAAKPRQLDDDISKLFCATYSLGSSYGWNSRYLFLGGTPLNNVLFMMPTVIKEFKEKTKSQKVSFVALTDGESSPLYWSSKRGLSYGYYYDIIIRSATGELSHIPSGTEQTPAVIDIINKQMTDVTITNIFLGTRGVCSTYLRKMGLNLDDKLFTKDGSYSVSDKNGWPLIALINPSTFGDSDEEMEDKEYKTKAQLKASFKKLLKSRSTSRKILSTLSNQFA
jgi:hypothetical protein